MVTKNTRLRIATRRRSTSLHRSLGFTGVGTVIAFACCSAANEGVETLTGAGGKEPVSTSGPAVGAGGGPACVPIVDGVPLSQGDGLVPHLTRHGAGFAAAWLEGKKVLVALVSATGDVHRRVVVGNAGGAAGMPSVHVTNDGLVALWSDGADVMARRLATDGTPVGAPFVVATTTSLEPRPAAASLDDKLAVAWMSNPETVAVTVAQTSVAPASSATGWFPAVTSGAGGASIAWSYGGRTGPVRVAALDGMGSSDFVQLPNSQALVKSLLYAGGAHYVSWEDVATSTEQVHLARVDLTNGLVSARVTVAPTDASANWPSIAVAGGRVAVAYYQFRSNAPEVLLAVFDSSLGQQEFEHTLATNARFPSAVGFEDRFAVAYNRNGGRIELSVVDCP